MAHYAEVIDGTVARVLAVHNDVITIDGVEDEQRGIDFLNDLFPDSATWVQTSYNTSGNVLHGSDHTHPSFIPRTVVRGTPFRMNYAGIGFTWDGTGFAPPQPYGSWSLDENYVWQPPTPRPDDGKLYEWDEDTTSWVE